MAAGITTGYRFGVYGADSKGTVKGATSQRVEVTYDHDLETRWDRDRKEFEANTFPLVVSDN